jgi:hypothetical protein
VVRDSFAKCEVDSIGVVDEEAQRVAPRFLEGDQLDVAVQLGQLLLNFLLGGLGHAW